MAVITARLRWALCGTWVVWALACQTPAGNARPSLPATAGPMARNVERAPRPPTAASRAEATPATAPKPCAEACPSGSTCDAALGVCADPLCAGRCPSGRSCHRSPQGECVALGPPGAELIRGTSETKLPAPAPDPARQDSDRPPTLAGSSGAHR